MTSSAPRVLVGSAGWSYPDWEGVLYPSRKPKGFHALRHVARWIDLAEVNASFYRIPSPAHAQGWVEAVADLPRFEFAAKLYRGLTHESPGDHAFASMAEEYHRFLEPLASSGRLAAVLLQFPFSFHATAENWGWANKLFGEFRAYPLVIEVRHVSWWKPRLFDLLEERGVAVASIDQPTLANNIGPDLRLTGPFAYIRFHGRNAANWWTAKEGPDRYDYLYGAEEIHEWAARIRSLLPRGRDIRAIFNNHVRGQGIAGALMLSHALGLERPPAPAGLYRLHGAVLRAAGIAAEEAQESGVGEAGDLFQ